MKWWEVRKHVLVREHRKLNNEWSENDFEFYQKENLLWLTGHLKLPLQHGGNLDFEFDLKYPENYPFSVPFIYPKKREKNWVGNHQFISSAFCLDIREKSWNSSLTAVDIIRSLEKLLLATLAVIEERSDTLEIYEPPEPTKLDGIVKDKRSCIVPKAYLNNQTGKTGYFNYLSPVNDNRIVVAPRYSLKSKEGITKIITDPFFKIWGLNTFTDKKGIWIKAKSDVLESIVFKEDLSSFRDFLSKKNLLVKDDLVKTLDDDKRDKFLFFSDDLPVLLSVIDFKKNKVEHFGCYENDLSQLQSRLPQGIDDSLKDLKVTIVGCGSGGSYIAEELVKSGITNLILVDDEYLTTENILRHHCNIRDVGLKKVDALKKSLEKINPKISVKTFDTKVNIVSSKLEKEISSSKLLINATASIEEILNEICWQYSIPSIHPKVYPLGFGGEIIRVIPKVTPCYECLNNQLASLIESIDKSDDLPVQGIINYNETEEGEMLPTPSLSVDARFISLIASKMALEVLNNNEIQKLEAESNIILWGNERKWIFNQSYESLAVDTSSFRSFDNCLVCFGETQIEKDLELSKDEIIEVAKTIEIKNHED